MSQSTQFKVHFEKVKFLKSAINTFSQRAEQDLSSSAKTRDETFIG